jgi:hypothetical protein
MSFGTNLKIPPLLQKMGVVGLILISMVECVPKVTFGWEYISKCVNCKSEIDGKLSLSRSTERKLKDWNIEVFEYNEKNQVIHSTSYRKIERNDY